MFCAAILCCLMHSLNSGCVAQVQGKTAADQYLVFPDHYCSCQAFFYEVVSRSEAPYVSVLISLMVG